MGTALGIMATTAYCQPRKPSQTRAMMAAEAMPKVTHWSRRRLWMRLVRRTKKPVTSGAGAGGPRTTGEGEEGRCGRGRGRETRAQLGREMTAHRPAVLLPRCLLLWAGILRWRFA